ncbi:LemA family protein [Aliikangiella sp. G2MR2-5]|uniref:LemA family protein n=1 Tax=Aliikangiella sp. G2MR2-5 TaxID=2788943 RepID=UPI0018AB1551|nr:LemA family protein [Aliikangiella sp. G2MR2-5]
MSIASMITLGIATIVLIYLIIIYNGLVGLKHTVSKSFANIDVLLKQRHDELPKLVQVCKQYMTYEEKTFKSIVQARNDVAKANVAGNMKALGDAETQLRTGLGNLFALAENYPELKADQTFIHLQQRISGLENGIADRREVYNDSVNNNNIRIEQVPDVFVAKLFGFKPFEMLKFSESEKANVDIGQLFKS